MAIGAGTLWRIRASGSNTNGGGYDSTISGAGTDYTDQDSAQLTLTDLATSGAGSTTLTSATGGFTSAMIGNCIRISSGTNFQADYYFITAYTNTNTVTVDRTPTSGGAGSGGNGKLGGAFVNFENFATSSAGNAFYATPTISSPLSAGHRIYIRGSGGEDPVSADYSWTLDGYWIISKSGDITNGRIAIIGYNGRPRIDGNLYAPVYNNGSYWAITNVHLKHTKSNNIGAFFWVAAGYYDVWIDQAGFTCIGAVATAAINCKFFNTGSTTQGTANYPAIQAQGDYSSVIKNTSIIDWKSEGIISLNNYYTYILDNVIDSCKREGIKTGLNNAAAQILICNNTIYNCSSDAIYLGDVEGISEIKDNLLISNGGYGINVSGTSAINDKWLSITAKRNFFYNNTSGARNGMSAGSNDVTLTGDPFMNAASNNFTLNNTSGAGAAARAAATIVFPGSLGTSYADAGAMQHQESAGGTAGGLFVNAGFNGYRRSS